jgi:hypothetical protein
VAIAMPSPSPRTLLTVGRLRYLVLRADPGGPVESTGLDNFGDVPGRPLPPRLRWSRGAAQLRWLLLCGHFLASDDA